MSSTSKSKSSTSGSGAPVVTGSGSGSGTGAIPTGNIPASSGSQQTNQTPGSLNDENINSQKPISDSSEKRKKKSSKNRSDGHIDLEEAHRAAEEKAEELRKQAEIALKQQEEEDRLRREDMFQPWSRVSLDTQFTPHPPPAISGPQATPLFLWVENFSFLGVRVCPWALHRGDKLLNLF
jgi:hypothetical protein